MSEPAVEFRSVSYVYPGSRRPAVENVSLRVEHGQRLGILGPNGGGKSTLLKLTLGLLAGYSGSIRVYGMSPVQARRKGLIGYVPQRNEAELAFPLNARQVVQMGAAWRAPAWRGLPRSARDRVEHMLELVGATGFADRPVGVLSGGQLQRVMIARALAGTPRLVALDEPTVGVDAAGQKRFADLLGRVHQELDVTILIVSHDLRAIVAGCDTVACMRRSLHSHVSPQGLTPQVLGELFSHEIEGAPIDMHIHTHLAAECDVESAPHAGHVHGPGDSGAGRKAGGVGEGGGAADG